jgi:hypothetical protein
VATSCKLPKVVTDAAIPRKVNAACLLTGDGHRVFYVAAGGRHSAQGDVTGRTASRYFATATAFARFIRANY